MPTAKTARKASGTTTKKTEKKPAKAAAPKPAKKVTLEDVWAIIAEIGIAHKELEKAHRETEQAINETRKIHKETEKTMHELSLSQKETQIVIKRLTKNVGGLNQSIGELIEILIAAHLWEKFPEYDLQRAYRRLPVYDEKNKEKAEVDILLVNTEWAMAVEVKRQADAEDVKEHIERMKRILKYPPAELKLRPEIKLLGALAGGIVTSEARTAAHNAGFFVLELAGESVIRIPEPAGFKPKEW
ncbi:MAG: hypothetical protein LBG72_00505 [Spirochaetaceae bacterium]|jgi:predicted AAA+ superfamily ATPase|nr:hypothetical protein [Spirochaetaceae bacterium]